MKKSKIILPIIFSLFTTIAISVPLVSCGTTQPSDPIEEPQVDNGNEPEDTTSGELQRALPTSINEGVIKNLVLQMWPNFFSTSGASAKMLIDKNHLQFKEKITANFSKVFSNYPPELKNIIEYQKYELVTDLSKDNIVTIEFKNIPVYNADGVLLNDGSLVEKLSGFKYYEPLPIPPPIDGHPRLMIGSKQLNEINQIITSTFQTAHTYKEIGRLGPTLVKNLNASNVAQQKSIKFKDAWFEEDYSPVNNYKKFKASILTQLPGNNWLGIDPSGDGMGYSVKDGFTLITPPFASSISNSNMLAPDPNYAHITEMPQTLEQLRNTDPRSLTELKIYDSRKYPIVTQLKDQGKEGICWSYATMAASETSILKDGNDVASDYNVNNLNLDPQNFDYDTSVYKPNADPLNNNPGDNHEIKTVGSGYLCTSAVIGLQRWMGPSIKSSAESYAFLPQVANLESFENVFNPTTEQIKMLVAKYGACSIAFHSFKNMTKYQNIYSPKPPINHSVTVVGWNDTIPVKDFWPSQPSRPGGFIVKNSWGPQAHKGTGYFILSYDSFIQSASAVKYSKFNEYNNNYYYDSFIDEVAGGYGEKAANIYSAKKASKNTTELLKAVNVISNDSDMAVGIKIYRNPTLDNPESGTLEYMGSDYFRTLGSHTIKLDNPIQLYPGDTFSIVITPKDGSLCVSNGETSTNDLSYGCFLGRWENIRQTRKKVVRIKAFTQSSQNNTYSLSKSNLIQDADIDLKIINDKLVPTVSLNNQQLIRDIDYSLQYNHQTKMMKVIGLNDYHGAKEVKFDLSPRIQSTSASSWTINETMNSIKLAGQYLAKFNRNNS